MEPLLCINPAPKGPGVAREASAGGQHFLGLVLGEENPFLFQLGQKPNCNAGAQKFSVCRFIHSLPLSTHTPLPLPTIYRRSGCVPLTASVPPGIFAVAGSSSFWGETLWIHKHVASI